MDCCNFNIHWHGWQLNKTTIWHWWNSAFKLRFVKRFAMSDTMLDGEATSNWIWIILWRLHQSTGILINRAVWLITFRIDEARMDDEPIQCQIKCTPSRVLSPVSPTQANGPTTNLFPNPKPTQFYELFRSNAISSKTIKRSVNTDYRCRGLHSEGNHMDPIVCVGHSFYSYHLVFLKLF